MRILLLIILIPFSGIYSRAQTNFDSLYTVWQDGSQSDSSRVKALSTFIWEGVMFNDADSAVQLSDAMIDFAEQQNYLEGLIEGHHCKGTAYHTQGNYIKAGEHYEKSIAFAEEAGDLQGSAATFNGWASVMDNLGQRKGQDEDVFRDNSRIKLIQLPILRYQTKPNESLLVLLLCTVSLSRIGQCTI